MMTTTQSLPTPSVPETFIDLEHGWGLPVSPTLPHTQDHPARKPEVPNDPDQKLVYGLRRGEDWAFATLLDRYHSRLVRVANTFVPSQAVAEEVVQETWLVVWEGIDRFKGESSFKTWLYRILTNRAKSKGIREHRYVPFPDAANSTDHEADSVGDIDRLPSSHTSSGATEAWQRTREEHTPERLLLSKEGMAELERAIEALPENQRQVILLRDIEGMTAEDACSLLRLTPGNQRILLHRARVKVRKVLRQYLEGSTPNSQV